MCAMRRRHSPKILVIIPTDTFTQRQTLEGLLAYIHQKTNPPWQLHLDLNDMNPQTVRRPQAWGCDGIIAYIRDYGELKKYTRSGIPTVLMDPYGARRRKWNVPQNIVSITNDHYMEGRSAAEYFLSRGYSNFAYVGTAKPFPWSVDRGRGFASRVSAAGHTCIVYPDLTASEQDDFALESRRLVTWLKDLPKPVALFAVHDRRAQQIISTAVNSGMRVPEEIAVLGVDNDTLLCETTSPAISSMDVYSHDQGRLCGRILDALLHGRKCPPVMRFTHGIFVTRQSTDVTASSSPIINKALEHIQSHISENLRVKDIARLCGCTPKTLQLLAHHMFGHTMGDEIRRRRLELAAQLLATTRRSVGDIALYCGFCGASHMGLLFKQAFGRAPLAYRRGLAESRFRTARV